MSSDSALTEWSNEQTRVPEDGFFVLCENQERGHTLDNLMKRISKPTKFYFWLICEASDHNRESWLCRNHFQIRYVQRRCYLGTPTDLLWLTPPTTQLPQKYCTKRGNPKANVICRSKGTDSSYSVQVKNKSIHAQLMICLILGLALFSEGICYWHPVISNTVFSSPWVQSSRGEVHCPFFKITIHFLFLDQKIYEGDTSSSCRVLDPMSSEPHMCYMSQYVKRRKRRRKKNWKGGDLSFK